MSFREWASRPFADGAHRIEQWPLDVLHPMRHGRIALDLTVAGGSVTACSIDVGANHRGDERLLEVRDIRQGMALANRHGWLTAAHAESLYARIAEGMLGITPSPRALALRGLAMALTAAATDALWDHCIASLDGTPDGGALARRAEALAALEALTGARMHVTYARIGGVAADIEPALLDGLLEGPTDAVRAAAAGVRDAEGSIAVPLPKVLRLPVGDAYDELDTPHGPLGMWLVSRGERVPHRVHLRTPGFAALASLERRAPGMATDGLLLELASTRFVPGEVSR